MATTLQDLLHGTQIPGAGNRLYNWAEKVSQAVDAGGGVLAAACWEMALPDYAIPTNPQKLVNVDTVEAVGDGSLQRVRVTFFPPCACGVFSCRVL